MPWYIFKNLPVSFLFQWIAFPAWGCAVCYQNSSSHSNPYVAATLVLMFLPLVLLVAAGLGIWWYRRSR